MQKRKAKRAKSETNFQVPNLQFPSNFQISKLPASALASPRLRKASEASAGKQFPNTDALVFEI